MRPLVAALAAVLPLWAIAQSRVPVLPPPAPKTVPIPAASWRVYGSGSAAPVNTANSRGGIDQTIEQSSSKAIYQWTSFDISSDSSVTFDMALRGSSALNRVIGSAAPSRIFGVLKATNGGEIVLINSNGILFGRGAQVDVGSLTASALNITDDEFKSSLVNAIGNPVPAFQYDGLAENFVDEKNFVRVDGGANIVTENGGRVFLFAKRVENAGTITTPGGQAVLAGGERVYVALPTADSFATLYAAESNPDVPILRGLVVEVGRGPSGVDGSALNDVSGHISAPRGNITIVGMAVNQNGRLSATTSVAENGSIILRAQGAAVPGTKQATEAGQLILGENSVTEILPDTQTDAQGNELTSNDSAGFITSRVELAGSSVRLIEGTNVIAPGGEVNISAEERPRYDPSTPYSGNNPLSRIVIGADVLIDVSGTTDAQIDGERNFATTELLGSNDLRDAPLQKDGLLYRSKVTLDTRQTSPILGDLSSYRSAEQRGIAERLSAGGSVSLIAQGGVVMRDTARIDLSGGQIRFSEAHVAPTMLMAEDGTMFDLNTAPADLVYVRAYNLQKASNADYDRWGLKVNYGGVLPGRIEPGYVQGQAAGSISIIAPTTVLDGQLIAHTSAGQRQLEGDDAQAETGRFSLGAGVNAGSLFGSRDYAGAVLRNASITETAEPVDTAFWDAPMRNELPEETLLSLQKLREAGFGHIEVTANNDVSLDAGEQGFEWADGGSLTLRSKSSDVSVSGDLRSAASTVELRSLEGGVELAAGSRIDVSGRWLNQQLDGPTGSSSIQGGSVTLAGLGRVAMEAGSLIDVSGGAVVDPSGSVSGGDAGAIVIDAGRALSSSSVSDATLQLGGRLQGYAIDNGGSLSISVPSVLVASRAAPADPLAPGASLSLDPGFFRQGGFASYSVDGVYAAFVATGTQIVAARNAYIAPAQPQRIETGTPISDVMRIGQPLLSPPLTVDVALSSSGNTAAGADTGGRLTFRPGALLQTPDASTVELSAAQTLRFNGAIVNKAGDVTLSTGTTATIDSVPSFLWLGETSRIDVSGVVRLDPAATDGVRGEVLAGGHVVLRTGRSADDRASSLVWKQGSEIAAQGVQAALDVTTLGPAGVETRRESVASDGGSLTVVGNRDIYLEGELHAQGGSAAAPGGRLSVSLVQGRDIDGAEVLPADRELTITESVNTALSPATAGDIAAFDALPGQASVSAELVRNAGVADVAISSRERIVIDSSVDLEAPRSIQLQAKAVGVLPGGGDAAIVAPTVSVVQTVKDGGLDEANGVQRPLPEATAGEGSLRVDAHNIVIDGRIALQGIGDVRWEAQQDIRLQGIDFSAATTTSPPLLTGSLLTDASVTLAAQRIYPATGTTFTIASNDKAVTIERNGPAPSDSAAPLSAGGTLVIDAGSIDQQGALYAPHGRIELRSRSDITLGDGSITSVSGDGAVVPYGRAAIDGSAWYGPKIGNPALDDVALTAPPAKTIILDAQEGFVDAQAGAAIDLSGGGELKAYSFVPGPGGSSDVFAGSDGAFAILPAAGSGLTPADASFTSQIVAPGREIVIGEDAPVPPGRYVLMPARYALLPGGFLVKPDDGGLPYALQTGTAIAQTNGSTLIGVQLADTRTAYGPALPTTWRITPSNVARKSSEIRDAGATPFFTALAQDAATALPRLPIDAGGLTLSAAQAHLAADIDFAGAAAGEQEGTEAGRGGDLQVVADRVRVVDSASATPQPGELLLQAAQLSASGAATLLLGAERGGVDGDSDKLIVGANEVVVDTPQTALRAEAIVLAAQSEVTITPGSKIDAVAGDTVAEPNLLSVRGDGAAVLASAAPGSELQRTNAKLIEGRLGIGAGADISAVGGTLVLDATGATVIDACSRVSAADVTITAPRMAVGEVSVPQPDTLAISTALIEQLSMADALTLRAYQALQFADGADLDLGAASRLTIDTPLLDAGAADAVGAQLTAGSLRLQNTTGSVAAAAPGSDGVLNLRALAGPPNPDDTDRGRIVIGNGEVRFAAGLTRATADSQLALASGKGQLHADGALTIVAPAIAAVDSRASAIIDAGGSLSVLQAQVSAANPLPVQAEAGAALALSGASVAIDTAVTLPAGKVIVEATGASASQGVNLQDGARIDASGRRFVIDGSAVDVPAGTVTIAAAAGSIVLDHGAMVDVSGIGLGAAGNLSLLAAQGNISLLGNLRGFSGDTSGQTGDGLLPSGMGASLTIDSRNATDFAGLQQSITDGERSAFKRSIMVRNREGDQTVAAGVTLVAESIALQSDGGDLRIDGELDASGAKGGRIELSAAGDLVLGRGGELLANAATAGGEGGQVLMNTADGEIRLEAGSRIDTAGAGSGFGGTLQLRAPRENAGDGQAGDEVRIAPIAGEVLGARRIDVEAVKVYEGNTIQPPDVLPSGADGVVYSSEFNADGLAFLGAGGVNATAIATRLSAGNPTIAATMRVHPGAEVRSSGDLTYDGSLSTSDWYMRAESVDPSAASAHTGDTSVTLRAAGNLVLSNGLVTGFDSLFGPVPTSSAGGDIRVVAGADLNAAAPMSVVRGGEGDVQLGRFIAPGAQPTLVASTTGDIRIAAAGDVDMQTYRTAVFTSGVAVADNTSNAAIAGIEQGIDTQGSFATTIDLITGEDLIVSPFRIDGGSIDIFSGGSVRGDVFVGRSLEGKGELSPADWRVVRPYVAEDGSDAAAWWTHLPGTTVFNGYTGDLRETAQIPIFETGVATLGGGDVRVQASQDVLNLGASAAGSGVVSGRVEDGTQAVRRYGGGDVFVQAGRDVVNGQFSASGETLRVAAGRDIESKTKLRDVKGEEVSGFAVYHENTAVDITARRDIDMLSSTTLFGVDGQWIPGLDGDARLQVVAAGGSLRYAPAGTPELDTGREASYLIAPYALIAAPQGSLALDGQIIQQPVDDAALNILSRDDLTTTTGAIVGVNATRGSDLGLDFVRPFQDSWNPVPVVEDGQEISVVLEEQQLLGDHGSRLDRSSRTPVHLASQQGSLGLEGRLASARPVRLVASGDIDLPPGEVQAPVRIQHQTQRWDPASAAFVPTSELTLFEAGGAIRFGASTKLSQAGAGDLVLIAGDDIDLGLNGGIDAVGNNLNATVLPEGSANITLVAGLRADGQDYEQAVLRGFHALGGLGLADKAGDLYALLSSDEPTVSLGSSTARSFDAAGLDSRLSQSRALVGDEAYNASIATYVRSLPGNEGLSDAAAVARFDTLSSSLRDPAPGLVLADAFAAQDAARRSTFVAQVAQAGGDALYGSRLVQYMQRVSGGQTFDLADAVAAFEALPLERQVPLLNQNLVQDLRTNGRIAAGSSDDAAAAGAYARGYRSVESLFPAERPGGSIISTTSRIRTEQGNAQAPQDNGNITLMAPGGAVNAGETLTEAFDPQSLGFVTVGGGDISSVVQDEFLVNRSRVFTLREGDILIWSSQGDIDAGRGAKTVVGAPAPVLRLNADGRLELDTSGSFTGSGIAVLDADSALDLYAPQGAIDAGEAGIRASGNAFFGAQVIRGADNLQIGGNAVGAPPPPPTVGATAGLAGASQDAANRAAAGAGDDEDERRKRRARRTLLLEFLGFGDRG